MNMADVFNTLNAINVNDHTEKKNGLTYLSWAWAWGEAKKRYPDAFYTIYENADGWFYHTDGATCWVKTGVTINGLELVEYLPVMDFKNKSIPVGNVTSFDVNKAIQRSLTKAIARHGLGLYIYAGEDLPLSEAEAKELEKMGTQPAGTQRKTNRTVSKTAPATAAQPQAAAPAAQAPAQQEDPAKKAAAIRARWIKAIAEGIKTKSGADPREAFIKNYNPSEDDLANLDAEVMDYRLQHNIPANTVQQ